MTGDGDRYDKPGEEARVDMESVGSGEGGGGWLGRRCCG